MFVLIVPHPRRAIENLIQAGHIPGLKKELVAVRRAEIEGRFRLGQHRILLRMEKRRIEFKARREHECSAVIGVVAQKEIGHWSLRAGRGDGWMRVDDRSRSVEPRIRDAPESHLAIVVGHVFEQILDRVVRV